MKKPRGAIQDTVNELERLAAVTHLASWLVNSGLVRDAWIIPPVKLVQPGTDKWRTSTELN